MRGHSIFHTRLLAAFAGAALVVAALAVTTWTLSQDTLQALLWVSRTREVIDHIAHAKADTLAIELHTQRYRLSGNKAELAERDAAIAARETALRRIKEMTLDDAQQQARWAQLREVANQRLAISRRAVLLAQTQGAAAASAYVASAPLQETRERIFGLFREMEADERRLLDRRVAEQQRTREFALAANALFALALVALLAATYVVIRRQLQANDASRRTLEAANAQIAAILAAVADGVVTIDEVGTVETFNPAAERMFGYAAAEAIGHNVKMLMPEPFCSEHDGYLARYRATGEARIIGIGREALGLRKDGSTFALELAISEMRLDGKRHFTGVVRDITARRQAEAELRESEESLATTLQSIGDAVLATDVEGCLTRMNPVAERLTGWPVAEALGRPVDEIFHIVNEDSRDPAVVPVARVLATGTLQGMANHTLLISRDGSECPIDDSAAPIRDADGSVSGVVLVFRDVSVQRDAERLIRGQQALLEQRVAERTTQLRESEQRFRLLVEGTRDYAFVMLDPQGHVVTWTEGARCLEGYAEAEVLGQPMACFYPPEDVAAGKPAAALAQAAAGGHCEVEGWRVRKDGTRFYANVNLTALRDPAGELVGFAKITRDVTERRRAEQAIQDLNASLERRVAERTQQLDEASRAKSDFLANMSHELRTPLNAIIGFSEMLKDGVLGELEARQRGFVSDIFAAGEHLLLLINDILDLAKVEAGALRLETQPVGVAALLKASLQMVRESALTHRIRLDTEIDSALGTMLVDERKLKQIVYNLLSNAVKFTPAGGAVTLHARRCTRAEVALNDARPGRLIALPPGTTAEFLALCVEDSGSGIAEADLALLFEPFSQVDNSLARRHAGTGLGLSLVRRLAELHGGTVGAASRPGAGSRFCVWLPYVASAAAADEVAPQAAAASATAAAAFAPSAFDAAAPASPLALVIEDDDATAELIATQLRAEGYAVIRAATAEEGLVHAAKRHPQLITLDIFLPAMDGWEFMQRLQSDPVLADTPVVIITVSPNLDRGLALGARRVLQKPFGRNELVAALAGMTCQPPDGSAACILVVDDNVQVVELLDVLLTSAGYRVLRAYGGEEAIEATRRERPGAVILDLMMPEVSGFEVAHALRQSAHTASIPIIVLTAKDLGAEDRARLNGKVGAILDKSRFTIGGLVAELRRAGLGTVDGRFTGT